MSECCRFTRHDRHLVNPHKNIGIVAAHSWRIHAIFILLLLSLVALFYSRALLSITMFGLFAVTVFHRHVGEQLKNFTRNPLLLGMSFLFLIPFISGLWSADQEEWLNVMRVKLPLLLTPIVFACRWRLSEQKWRYVGFLFIVLTVIATGWSLLQYLRDMEEVHEGYLRSKIIRTPLDNDHIRFSWMVSMAILLCLLFIHIVPAKLTRWLMGAAALWLAAYLHILSARTGLLTFYMVVIIYSLWLLFTNRHRKLAAAGIVLLVLLPLLAWMVLPTFRNRIRYMLYDISHVRAQTYLPGSNDGNRIMSLRAGWNILAEHPFGVGAGDVKGEAYRWYDRNIPGILQSDKIEPSSEWLIYGDAAGWPAVLLFTIIMLIPLLLKNIRHRVFWIALNITAAFSFLFDIGLEGQYGVFLYVLLVAWWWKWFTDEPGDGYFPASSSSYTP
ncbi:MAG TPA: O-antigen ligase family protein [Flavisolibacter sp.]